MLVYITLEAIHLFSIKNQDKEFTFIEKWDRSAIWDKDVKHNQGVDWIQKEAEEMQGNKQQNIEVTPNKNQRKN